jgi:hypothetical protein
VIRWSLITSEKVGKKIDGQKRQTKLEWVQHLEEDGHNVTGMLPDEPELFKDLHIYWNAFHILTSSRNSGMSIGAIPLQAYESYFRIFSVDSLEEQLEYLKFVGALDNEYLKWSGESSEKQRQKNASKEKKGPKAK